MSQLRLLGEPPASDDHAALANLAFPQAGHTGFVAAAGLAGGQTIIGGTAASENLSLQSTAGSPRGVVRIMDSLRLVGNVVQDSEGATRLTLATASPHVKASGDFLVDQSRAAVGIGAAAVSSDTHLLVKRSGVPTLGDAAVKTEGGGLGAPIPAGDVWGVGGLINYGGNAAANLLAGLMFFASYAGTSPGTCSKLAAIYAYYSAMGYSGTTLTGAYGLYIAPPAGFPTRMRPTNAYGIYVPNLAQPGAASSITTNAYGIRVEDTVSAYITNTYLIEAGPATPYLRLVGSAAPGAGLTNLYLNEGGTLRRVQWKDFSTLVAGDRVMVLV